MNTGGSPHICGGRTNDGIVFSGTCIEYDFSTDSWSETGATLSSPKYYFGSAVSSVDGIVIAGGFYEDFTNAVEATTSGDSFTDLSPLPTPTSHQCLAATDSGLFMTGGWNESSPAVFETFLYEGGSWTMVEDMPTGRRGASCFEIDGQVIVAGGHDEEDNYLDVVEIFDLTSKVITDKSRQHSP